MSTASTPPPGDTPGPFPEQLDAGPRREFPTTDPYAPAAAYGGDPKPPVKKKSKLPLLIGLVVAVALAIIIGGIVWAITRPDVQTFEGPNGTQTTKAAPSTSAEASTEPEAEGEPSGDPPYVENEETEAPVDPQQVGVSTTKGATITSLDTGATATIYLEKVTKGKCQYESIGCERPENGLVYQFHIFMKVDKGKGSVSISPDHFYFESPDGERYTYDNGNASEYGSGETLDSSNVRAGRQVRGVLKFDAPKNLKGSFLVLTAGPYDEEVIAEWKL